ncbi:hypothetical protein WJX75_009233 [Coccomyxa subellipsoidea]|uniref:Inositol-pentakisphosphate 2-kinase n=1 Tax=Coccomyxa subellipsoidea TaxID=248742 RepID=A0ABR2YLR5_9CHLO
MQTQSSHTLAIRESWFAMWHADDNQGGCQAAWETSEMGQAGTLCVEIKPKCGFLPTSALIRPEHAVKRRVPRFQLHQLLKLEQGKIQRLSAYNPLDLFSGSPQRMEAALAALFEEPQNNLRLFLGGAAVQLPKDGKLPGGPTMQQLGGVSGLTRLLRSILLREGVLDRILEVQKMDVHDIEGIHPLLATLLQKQPSRSQLTDTPNCWQHAANEYKQEAGTQLPAVQEDPDVGSVVQDSETRRWFRYKGPVTSDNFDLQIVD